MPARKKVSDAIVSESYLRLKSVKLVSAEVGICPQSVHERVVKLGIVNKRNDFTKEDDIKLIELYEDYAKSGQLIELAKVFGRTKQFLCRQAKRLGLTKIGRKAKEFKSYEKVKEFARIRWDLFEHPKGMKGKKHTDKSRLMMSKSQKVRQIEVNESGGRMAIVQKQLKTKASKYGATSTKRSKCTWDQSWKVVSGRIFYFRSNWEYQYALYLEWLARESKIVSWDYEPDIFWFKEVLDGNISYTPDFKIVLNNRLIEYHEVKGWMDDRSIAKLSKMKKEYPDVSLKLINKAWFKENNSLYSVIDTWKGLKVIK